MGNDRQRDNAALPHVGIVTVNWNGWRDTIECLDSLSGSAYPHYSIAVVDNGSTNESEQQIRQAYPSVHVLQTGLNLGYPGGANRGIRFFLEQGTRFIWLINNDTVVDRGALRSLVDLALRDPHAGLVASAVRSYNSRDRLEFWGGGTYNPWLGTTQHVTEPGLPLDYLCGTSLLVKADAFDAIGLLNERLVFYWDDVEFSLRARAAGWHLAVADDSVVYHKGGGTVRRMSARSDYLNTESMTVFLVERHGLRAVVPLTVRIGGKVVNRLLRRQPRHLIAVFRGMVAGYQRLTKQIHGMRP